MTHTVEAIKQIKVEACAAAYQAADKFFKEELNGVDQLSCGFAWVSIREYNGTRLAGNTREGRMLKAAGISQNWSRTFEIWNPSGYPCQNVDTLEVGARAAAKVFESYGFKASAGSRLD
jgi:hypothetical protein